MSLVAYECSPDNKNHHSKPLLAASDPHSNIGVGPLISLVPDSTCMWRTLLLSLTTWSSLYAASARGVSHESQPCQAPRLKSQGTRKILDKRLLSTLCDTT
jgi:hypothetical protein